MNEFKMVADRKGVVWDLLLYIPTVVALGSIATSFWFNDNQGMGYLFYFLSSFFVFAGINRIFKTRLLLFPSSPTTIKIQGNTLLLTLKSGDLINLIKNVKYYSEFSGKTFGVSGMDGTGKQQQFVFHKGQFPQSEEYDKIQKILKEQIK